MPFFCPCSGTCMHAYSSPGSVDNKGHWTKSKGLLVSASQCGLAASSQPSSIHGWPSLHALFFSPWALLALQNLSAFLFFIFGQFGFRLMVFFKFIIIFVLETLREYNSLFTAVTCHDIQHWRLWAGISLWLTLQRHV